MDVVINGQYGGFSLSPEGVRDYLGRKGKEVYFYTPDYSNGYGLREYIRFDIDNEPQNTLFFLAFTTDRGYRFTPKHDEDMSDMFSDRSVDRSDPDLIETVRTLGDRANGKCARLRIVEIPDGVDYEIEEHDGNEWIAERHRTWS